MSKTDKTAPWRVRVLNDPTYLVEEHDHRHGPCDLPEERSWSARGWPKKTRCSWQPSQEFWANRENMCGCPACAHADHRRGRVRRARQRTRAALRQVRTGQVDPVDAATGQENIHRIYYR